MRPVQETETGSSKPCVCPRRESEAAWRGFVLDKTEIVVVQIRPRSVQISRKERESDMCERRRRLFVSRWELSATEKRTAVPARRGQSEAASTGARHGPLFFLSIGGGDTASAGSRASSLHNLGHPPLPPPHAERKREKICARVRRPSAVVARRALLLSSRSEQVCGAATAGVQERQHHAVRDRVRVAPAPPAAGFSATTARSPPLTLMRRRLQRGARRSGVGGGYRR